MYRWELDGSAQPTFETLSPAVRAILASFMDAVVIVDPIEYQWSTLRMTSCSSSGSSGSANEHRLGK